jgi:DNA-binding MarR family transcriptional regulator
MSNRRGSAKKPTHSRQGNHEAEGHPREVYGYLLTIRALARAAIKSDHVTPAMLRVLCVLAEYMDKDGKCRVGQDTIAARLGISRQAVNRHILSLVW